MAVDTSQTDIRSVEDALSRLTGGHHFVLCTPSADLVNAVLHRCSSSFVRLRKSPLVLSLSAGPGIDEVSPVKVNLSRYKSAREAAAAFMRTVNRTAKYSHVFIAVTDALPAPFKRPKSQKELVTSLLSSLSRKNCAITWFVRRDALSSEALTALKDGADYFLDVSRNEGRDIARFLSVKGSADPGQFEPRILSVTPDAVRLLPIAQSAPKGESDSSHAPYDRLPAGVVTFERTGASPEFNSRIHEALGYEEGEMASLKLSGIIVPAQYQYTLRSLAVLRTKRKHSFRTRVRRKSGREFDVEVIAQAYGKDKYVAVCMDITDLVRAEEEGQRISDEYRAFLTALPYPYAIFVHRSLSERNEAFVRLFPWLEKAVPSTSEFFGRRNSDLLKEISSLLDRSDDDGEILHREILVPAPDRKTVATEVSIARVTRDGKKALYCTFVDVAARRGVLDEAAAKEENFNALLTASPLPLSISHEGTFMQVNKAFAALFAYDGPMELLGKEATSLVAGRNARAAIAAQEKTLTTGTEDTLHYDYTGKRKDGAKISVEADAARIRIDGKPAVLTYHRDVTRQKTDEETLLRKTHALGVLNRISGEVAGAEGAGAILQHGLNAAMKNTHFESGAVLVANHQTGTMQLGARRAISDAVAAKLDGLNLDEGFARYFNKTHEPVVAPVAEYPAYLHYKSLFEAEHFATVAFLPVVVNGMLHAVLLLATKKGQPLDEGDTTVLASLGSHLGNALEKALLAGKAQDAEKRFMTTVGNISDVIYALNPSGTFEYISPNIEALLGYKPSDFSVNAGLWRTLLHPDDRPVLSQRISNQTHNEQEFILEYRILPKGKATYIWLRDAVRYTRDGDGNLIRIDGILRNITDSKLLAEATINQGRVAGAFDFDLLQSLPDGIAAFTGDMQCTAWNTAMEKVTGIARGDAVGSNLNDITPFRDTVRNLIEKSMESDSEESSDLEWTLPQSETNLSLHVRVIPQHDHQRKRVGTVVLADKSANISRLREDAAESEQLLRTVIDAMHEVVLISDLDGQVWEVNGAFSRVTGFGRDNVRLTTFPYPWLAEEQLTRYISCVASLRDTGEAPDPEMTWFRTDGTPVLMKLKFSLLMNVRSEPTGILCLARDISAQQGLTAELERKNRQIHFLSTIIRRANTPVDAAEVFEEIANELQSMIPYDGMSIAFLDESDQLIPWYLAVPSEGNGTARVHHLDLDASVIYDAVRTGKAVIVAGEENPKQHVRAQITIPLCVGDKTLGALSLISSRPDAYSGEELDVLQPVGVEIAGLLQRMRLQEKVQDDNAYIRDLLDSINNVVYTVDEQYRITAVNRAWQDFMHRMGLVQWTDEKSVLGQSLRVILPDEEMWEQYRQVMQDLFARRIPSYSRDFEVPGTTTAIAYHLVINPMIIKEKVVALVFSHTDITEINRTEAELKRRNRELVALNAIATSMNTSLEVEEVLRVAVDQLKEAFGAHVVAFYLLDEETQALTLSRQTGIPADYLPQLHHFAGDASLTGQVTTTGKPVYITDGLTADERLTHGLRDLYASLGLRSSAIVPLQAKDKVLGALVISFAKSGALTDNEQRLLLLISNQIGSVLEKTGLYAEVQRQVQTLTTLYELGKGLTGVLDLKGMLQVVFKYVRKTIPLERFYYLGYSRDDRSIAVLYSSEGETGEFSSAGPEVPERGWPSAIYETVARTGISFTGSTDPGSNDSLLAVAIKSGGRVIGIVSTVSSVPNQYKQAHLRLLESIANLTGVAIGKALLYEETLKKASEIESRNKELDDFTYVVSHDLKEPLISIEGYSKIVMNDYREKLDAEGREYLGSVVQSTARMKHLIEDLLTLSRLGRMSDTHERVAVGKVVEEILRELQFSLRERKVTVTVSPALPVVDYSATRLSMVFRNLISNAMKFNDKESPRIEIGVKEHDKDFEFFVADNGIGIDPQYHERIFTIFQRLKRSEEFRGTGAGLTIARKIVEMEGGRIRVESTPGEGSTFFFTIAKPS